MTELNDKELVSLFKSSPQREQVFRVIIERYQRKLYWHIRRMLVDHDDTDDVLQNVFIKVWKNLDQFKEEAQLYSWLYRIASNETISFIRKRKEERFIRLGETEQDIEGLLSEDHHFKGDEIQKKLQLAIQSLPEKQRLVFNMKYYEEMKYEDMSEILETSVGALKASYHHAVKKIESYLRQQVLG